MRRTGSAGSHRVPTQAYYGPQTARALAGFPISGIPVSHFPAFIRALALVKKAAANTNGGLGDLPADKAVVIEAACDDIIAGDLHAEFPVDVFQGGAGTSTNMNMNELIANRALEKLGLERGRYEVIHPNNDVNLAQSTNDVYPTAIPLAILFSHGALREALEALAAEFGRKVQSSRKWSSWDVGSSRMPPNDARPGVQGIRRHAPGGRRKTR